jgi:tetratricopeptide (TPR) repeat protein
VSRTIHTPSWVLGVVIALLMACAVGLQAARERTGGLATVSAEVLYVRSPAVMTRLALSYDDLLADVYWIRAVQHYGSTKRSTAPDKSYGLLYPLLDLTTSLDDRFNMAYHFGSLFLAEPSPGGPGRPDLAIALLEKGLVAQPEKWEFVQAIGFVHYWWYEDYPAAASWFERAARMPGAPVWMGPLAAVTLAEGGRRDGSRALWQQIARTAEDGWYRNEANRRLMQLDALDEVDQLTAAVSAFERTRGAAPESWEALVSAGYLRALPSDPTGQPYRLAGRVVTLDAGSTLLPLPKNARSSR